MKNTVKKILAAVALVATFAAAAAETITSTSTQVYRTPSGKKYHISEKCGGGNSYGVTLDDAIGAKLDPCGKCCKKAITRVEYDADGIQLPGATVSKDTPTDAGEWINADAVKVVYTDKDGSTVAEFER